MPTATSIILNDGQGTPAAHTFVPVSVSPDRSILLDRDSVTSAGNKQLIVGFSGAKPGRPTNRVSVRLNMPVEVENTNTGLYEVPFVARFSCDVVIPDQMTQANRDDFAAFIKNALADTVINGLIADLDPLY